MITANSLLYELYVAYLDARKHKRTTHNQLVFEYHLEEHLLQLCEDILSGKYEISPSIYFIQKHPVKREIFAGDFRDRIVHHLVYNYISPIFEKTFIYDSYSCRKYKGTSKGVQRVMKFMRSASENYTKECYILKLDIQGYFMAINKDILYQKIQSVLTLNESSLCVPLAFLLPLLEKIVYNDPTTAGIFKGKKSDYH
ncbi:MAG: hypothetical protein LBG59_04765 [Candidatus Peribacteria bacterium]|jgi:retron-type reverse transcriptase|nr:hypothetical protein [Candidatus Peribacteria bacterium]